MGHSDSRGNWNRKQINNELKKNKKKIVNNKPGHKALLLPHNTADNALAKYSEHYNPGTTPNVFRLRLGGRLEEGGLGAKNFFGFPGFFGARISVALLTAIVMP